MKRSIIILSLLVILNILLRLPSVRVFELDETNYSYSAETIENGGLPYREVFCQKPPVIYFIYLAAHKVFSRRFYSPRLFAVIWSSLTLIALFFLAKKMFGAGTALLSVLFFSLFSHGPAIQGSSANTETFMILFTVLSAFFAVIAVEAEPGALIFFLSGFFAGLAVFTKQPAFLNLLAVLIFIVISRPTLRNIAVFTAGCAVIPLVFFLYFFRNNATRDFIYSVWIYNLTYSAGFGLRLLFLFGKSILLENFLLVISSLAFCLYAGRGIIRNFRAGGLTVKSPGGREYELFLLLQMALSFAGISLGMRYYPHYFIQIIPFACIASARIILELFPVTAERGRRKIAAVVIIFLLSPAVLSFRYYFRYSASEIYYNQYGDTGYDLAFEIAGFIRENTGPEDTVYAWNRFPQIYFLSGRKSATRFVFFPGLYTAEIAERIVPVYLKELKENRPKFIFLAERKDPGAVSFNTFLENNYFLRQDVFFELFFKAGGKKTVPVYERK